MDNVLVTKTLCHLTGTNMRTFILSFLFFSLTIFQLTSCNQNNPDEEEKKILQNQNDLLKKENEQLKKDLASNQRNFNEGNIESPNTTNVDFLKEFNGKYPYEVDLLNNKIINKRLKSLIGDKFRFLKKTWAVENPMEIRNNIFVASACEAHNCNMTNFILVIDMLKNIMYVGIRKEGQVSTYAESGNNFPEQIQLWSSEGL